MIKTVIMAGGQGSRIASLFPNIPKPLIPINDKPVLEREIECLKSQGYTDIIITVSHLKEQIISYFGDGKKFGVNIEYFVEESPLGTGGALYEIKDKLTDHFLLINADSIFDVNLVKFENFHAKSQGFVTLFAHPNSHPYDSGLLVVDKNLVVKKWLTKEDARPQYYKNLVNAGIHILSKKVLENRPEGTKVDLDRQIIRPLCEKGLVYAYCSPEYVKDMGTPERYESVVNDFKNNLPFKKNLLNKQKAIFLDRDGTINKYCGFLKNIDDLTLLPDVSDAIKDINASEYLAIVITNQPQIARGELTYEELDEIHNKLETELGKNGAFLNAIYFCPHHPDKGFEGEVKSLKIDCSCRKPKPGLLLKAAEDFNIDLSSSFMIGDRDNDVIAGQSAGCKTYKIATDGKINDIIKEILGK